MTWFRLSRFASLLRSRIPAVDALPVPGPLGRKWLAFLFVVLLEYWLAPLFLGITNYAGLWSDIGVGLFVALVASLTFFVVLPLRPHLRKALRAPGTRGLFYLLWSATMGIALWATDVVQLVPGPRQGGVALGQATVYSPFGAWTSLTLYFPSTGVWVVLNPELVGVLLFLTFLSSAALVLTRQRASIPCVVPPQRARRLREVLAPSAIVAPLGLVTGCTGCLPAYLSALALVAPATAVDLSAATPLVPWIGFAGLMYLLGFWVALRVLHRATATESRPASVEE